MSWDEQVRHAIDVNDNKGKITVAWKILQQYGRKRLASSVVCLQLKVYFMCKNFKLVTNVYRFLAVMLSKKSIVTR